MMSRVTLLCHIWHLQNQEVHVGFSIMHCPRQQEKNTRQKSCSPHHFWRGPHDNPCQQKAITRHKSCSPHHLWRGPPNTPRQQEQITRRKYWNPRHFWRGPHDTHISNEISARMALVALPVQMLLTWMPRDLHVSLCGHYSGACSFWRHTKNMKNLDMLSTSIACFLPVFHNGF